MATAVLDGELKTVRSSNRVTFAVATAADDRPLRRMLRETPMQGAVQITFEREPGYFLGENIGQGVDETIVARGGGGDVICMGRCSRRLSRVNGRVVTAAYLGELRLAASVQGRFDVVRRGYQFFQERERANPADIYFTSIASDNLRARRLLESARRGLPLYRFAGGLTTLLIPVPRRPAVKRLRIRAATLSDMPSLLALLNSHGQRYSLSAFWTADVLDSLERHGLPLERFQLASVGGELIACGALWDQRSFRQTVIRGYGKALSRFRPLINMGRSLLRTAALPPPGTTIPQALLSPLVMPDDSRALLADFIAALFPQAAALRLEFLTMALPSSDERIPFLQRCFSAREWRSRIYQVTWPGQASLSPASPILPDIAFL